MRGMLWMLGVILVLVTILGVLWMQEVHFFPSNGAAATPKVGESPPVVRCIGYVTGEKPMIHVYPKQLGQIVSVVNKGEKVKKGTPLIKMDDRIAHYQLDQAKAALEEAKASLESAKLGPVELKAAMEAQDAAVKAKQANRKMQQLKFEAENTSRTIESGVNEKRKEAQDEALKGMDADIAIEQSKYRLLQAKNPKLDIDRAQANVDAKKAQVNLAKAALDNCIESAPEDGTALLVNVNVGEVLGSNPLRPAIEFLPDSKHIVVAEIMQEWVTLVRPCQTVDLIDDTHSGASWKGKVKKLADFYGRSRLTFEPGFKIDVRIVECDIEITEGTHPLRIDQRVRVDIDISRK